MANISLVLVEAGAGALIGAMIGAVIGAVLGAIMGAAVEGGGRYDAHGMLGWLIGGTYGAYELQAAEARRQPAQGDEDADSEPDRRVGCLWSLGPVVGCAVLGGSVGAALGAVAFCVRLWL